MIMYKAVIFDLDGTLFDTLPDIQAVLNATLKKYGLPQLSREQTMSYIGSGAKELVRLAVGKENEYRLEEILSSYRQAYAENEGKLSCFFEGEEEALLALKASGIKLAVFTNKPHGVALKTNESYFAEFGFDCILGQTDELPLKPAPDGVFKILNQLGVSADECLFVGDGEMDVQTAKNAGLGCVSVLWGYRTREQLVLAGATKFAENFKNLQREILG